MECSGKGTDLRIENVKVGFDVESNCSALFAFAKQEIASKIVVPKNQNLRESLDLTDYVPG